MRFCALIKSRGFCTNGDTRHQLTLDEKLTHPIKLHKVLLKNLEKLEANTVNSIKLENYNGASFHAINKKGKLQISYCTIQITLFQHTRFLRDCIIIVCHNTIIAKLIE